MKRNFYIGLAFMHIGLVAMYAYIFTTPKGSGTTLWVSFIWAFITFLDWISYKAAKRNSR